MTKFIFVTGGVLSALGKGIAAASFGMLLESHGYKITLQKFDPYLNVDPGTMSPFQHGEVYVTDDGAETDLEVYRKLPEAAPLVEEVERFVRIYGHRAFRYASEFEAVRLAVAFGDSAPYRDLVRTRELPVADVSSPAALREFIRALDKAGELKRIPVMSVTMALVMSTDNKIEHFAEINDIASSLKEYGKRIKGSVVVKERRQEGAAEVKPTTAN